MTQLHIMLDLETWGKAPGCDIRSIGACVFDPVAGTAQSPVKGCRLPPGCFYIACDNPPIGPQGQIDPPSGLHRKYRLARDPSTVQWWNDQSTEAQAAFANPVELREALDRFGAWVAGITEPHRQCANNQWTGLRLWAHGPTFDASILAAVYEAVGLPVPWHYRAPRDTRTAFDMADVGDHSTFMQAYNYGTAHHALDDAISQARAVCAAYGIVRHWRDMAHCEQCGAEVDENCDGNNELVTCWRREKPAINEPVVEIAPKDTQI